jgi:effector-binding domain-containing protein
MSEFDVLECVEVEVEPVLALQVTGQCGSEPREIAAAMEATFGKLCELIRTSGVTPGGPPRAVYTSYGPEGIQFVVAMPLAQAPPEPIETEEAAIETLPGGATLRFTHHGPYAGLMQTYGLITQYMIAKGLMESEADWAGYMPMWEEYRNDPETTPPDELLTYIYLLEP